ncbi:sulfate transporter [Venturia nashicola]|uniref:Sulfate transporter n=1 Tax=Venturia nashicola TaxID=86259 RepID=A0A4Z1P081_9PEZI|nr:sulfate transporter [Venturia nashicola]
MSRFLSSLKTHHVHNVQTFRKQPLAEIAGSLGDLGTLLPLMIALTLSNSISLPSTLVFTGLANIITGVVFGLPLPVQPMKAIAAVAIARSFSIGENMAAGMTVSIAVFLMSVSGLLEWFSRVVPVPVVKGIQVGAGLSLVLSAGTSLLGPLSWLESGWGDDYFWALGAFFFLLFVTSVEKKRRGVLIPYALVVFAIGLVVASIQLSSGQSEDSNVEEAHLWHPKFYIPQGKYFWTTLSASLGQLPLTTLNSIIAVSHLSTDLLPNIAEPTPTSLGISVATMNLIGCWFGAMPTCHGSGGLAAQHRFGARSGASIIILGLLKLSLGLFIGEPIVSLLRHFPKSLLAVMVIAAGVELAKVGESLNVGARDLWEESAEGRVAKSLGERERKERWGVMLVTVAGLLAFKNDAVGFLAGLFWHWGLHAEEYWSKFKRGGEEEQESLLD